MSTHQIVVLGGGFAGLWSAVGAARQLDELGYSAKQAEISLVNRDAFHNIRVRNYEADLAHVRVPLDDVLEPIGVRRVEAEVDGIDFASQIVRLKSATGSTAIAYDRLVFALGSQLARPNLPGLSQFAFDIDTYGAAARLNDHLNALPKLPNSPGRFTTVIVGAGLTGIEAATELAAKLRSVLDRSNLSQPPRVILADHKPHVGSDMGESARPVIEAALQSLGIETRLGIEVAAADARGIVLRSGDRIEAATIVWCAGMQANRLTACFPVERDRFGRLPVDEYMQVCGVPNVLAAGDSAWSMMDDKHKSVMSCQHSRPMGRFAGHNVVCSLFGLPLLPLRIDWYVTVLDLGSWGAVYTEGWDRQVIAKGMAAKKAKRAINCERIYPPLNRDRRAILAAAAPIVQTPPLVQTK
ncbi:MAG: FAD-dependent oxidoreductase [Pirellulales bacterium]|nr:FAD-dependent oxidoreductase [Pirellulales bacterium]